MLHNLTLPTYNQWMDRVVQFQRQFIAFICDAKLPIQPEHEHYCQAFQKNDAIALWVEKWMRRKMKGSKESYAYHLCQLLVYLQQHPHLRQCLIDAFDHDSAYFDKLKVGSPHFAFFCTTKIEIKEGQKIRELLDPLMIAFYEDLFAKGFHSDIAAIDKDRFRTMFWEANQLNVCPACDGSITDSAYDIDHFLPKSVYPFLSMRATNLVPICKKCNFEEKRTKDPLDHTLPDPLMHTFHPFERPAIKDIKIKFLHDEKKQCQIRLEEKTGGTSRRLMRLNELFGLERRWGRVLREEIRRLESTMKSVVRSKRTRDWQPEDIVEFVLGMALDAEDEKLGQEAHYFVRKSYAYYALNDLDEKAIFIEMVWQELGMD